MEQFFSCTYDHERLIVQKKIPITLLSVTIWIDDQIVSQATDTNKVTLHRRDYDAGKHHLRIVSTYFLDGQVVANSDYYVFYGLDALEASRETTRSFRSGDLLIGCDNTFGIPHGYLGHTAIVIDEDSLVEAVAFFPAIRVDTIDQFLKEHPNHAQYRSKNVSIGKAAADWALNYHKTYRENIKNGIYRPLFSAVASVPLEDPWGSVYCSKLLWLSYYYGANIAFENDFGIFAPEDFERCLANNPDFECVYKHPLYEFKIDL